MSITDETRSIARARKERIGELTDAQVVALVSAWVAAYESMAEELDRIAYEIAHQYAEGATTAQLARSERVADALRISKERADELAEYAGARIIQDLPGITAEAGSSFQQMLRSQVPLDATLNIRFGDVNPEAFAAIVARSTSRIHSLSRPLSSDMEKAMKASLTRGIVEGTNPRETARRIMRDLEGDFMGGAARAATIARTESLDALRAADKVSADANADLIVANIWMAELSARTCMACTSLHGTEHPPDAFGPEGHPNCRCVYLTKLKPYSELGIHGVEEPPDVIQPGDGLRWFQNLTPDSQIAMMGEGKHELWSQGRIEWEDFHVKRENRDWRAAYYETPLKDLT